MGLIPFGTWMSITFQCRVGVPVTVIAELHPMYWLPWVKTLAGQQFVSHLAVTIPKKRLIMPLKSCRNVIVAQKYPHMQMRFHYNFACRIKENSDYALVFFNSITVISGQMPTLPEKPRKPNPRLMFRYLPFSLSIPAQ